MRGELAASPDRDRTIRPAQASLLVLRPGLSRRSGLGHLVACSPVTWFESRGAADAGHRRCGLDLALVMSRPDSECNQYAPARSVYVGLARNDVGGVRRRPGAVPGPR